VKPARREPAPRITPDLLAFHIKRAHALRAEAFRDAGRAIVALLVRLRRLVL
jgi:hypothetical protein